VEREYYEVLKTYSGQLTAYATNLLREGLITNDEHLEFTKGFTELTKSLVKLEPKESTENKDGT